MSDDCDFAKLLAFLHRVPSISTAIGKGVFENGNWWVKFSLDISHPLAWNVVQELGCVLNYVSLDERLPAVFMPVSPAPYMNGGPADFLSWVIESKEPSFTPDTAAKWLMATIRRRVTSYWSCYYRTQFPVLEEYPAFRVLQEIEGMRESAS